MAVRRPLILVGGTQYQLPPGDTLDAVALSLGSELLNNSVAIQQICTPVCAGVGSSGSGGFQPARANAIGTARVIGLIAAAQIAPNAAGAICQFGIFTATIPQWNLVTGLSGGITPGAPYYLVDTAAGRISTTPPSEVGRFCTKIGIALTPTSMLVAPSDPIGL